MPKESVTEWFYSTAPDWYEESKHEEEAGSSVPFASRTWLDMFVIAGPKPELWTLAQNKTNILDDYLQNLASQFAQRQKQLELTDSELERRFRFLVERWREETAHLSSITKQVMNFSYQRIIGMGPAVLPLLFRELQRKPEYWFWALEAITGENPTNPEEIGNVGKMAESWLRWAENRGYLNVSSARVLFRQLAEQQI